MRRAAKAGIVAGAVIAVAGMGALAVGPLGAGALTEARSVGDFPWSSAVTADRSARSLGIAVDVAGHDEAIGCDPAVDADVTETRSTVSITTRVVDRPLPPGVQCGSPGLLSLPATVRLHAPIGSRRLIDGTGKAEHAVLVVDEQPTIRAVPAPFTRRSTSWNEPERRVSEWWRWQGHGQAAQIDLDFGPRQSASRLGLQPADAHRNRVGGAAARVWRRQEGDMVTTDALWSPRPGREYHLEVLDQSTDPLDEGEVLALARAVR